MGSSDSETESECFESAEENFDEEEEGKKYEKTKSKKNLQKSEDEESKLVISDCNASESISTIEQGASSISLSYRKRPERVKRQHSRTQTKPVSKLPTNEIIFKADKIVPDVFLQDITSNLSKNINKSLSTLQQTSSNVKDMILNSLPVSSVNDKEGFSYDEKSILSADENNTLEPDANQQNNIQSVELEGNIIDEKVRPKDETSNAESEVLVGREGDSNNRRESENNGSQKKDFHSKHIITNDNSEDKILNFDEENFEKGSSDLDTQKVQAENVCKKAINIVSSEKEEVIQDSNNMFLNHEVLAEKEEIKENINETESVNFTEETEKKTEILENNQEICNLEPEINVKLKKEKETFESNTFFKPVDINKSENNANVDNFNENVNILTEDKNQIGVKCNFEELKTALKNIVNDENTSSKLNEDLEVKKQMNDNSGDGWDDFDFSEDEVENSNTNNSCKDKDLEDIKINNELIKSESPVLDVKNLKTKAETEKPKNLVGNEKNLKETSIPIKSHAEKSNLYISNKNENKKKSFIEAEKPKKLSVTSIVENESWDWDNWDEISESENVEATSGEKSKINKSKGNSPDVSNWSGWDTFGQKAQEKQENWSLGSWGVDALLNKATAVTQGISSVLEAGLGAPDPETLARMEKLERENSSELEKRIISTENQNPAEISKKNSVGNVNIFPVSGITSLVAEVTSKIVEHSKIQEIGSKVITGGLETLETFGKKTMEVLQEGDPGLKNKRALLLGNNKPVLSQVLKEAREKADRESKKAEEKELAKKCHFETLFDDFQGMVHLEALEMLSRQCELKLEQIRSGMNSEEQEDLNGILEEVEQLCSLDEYDIDMKCSVVDFKTSLRMAVEPLKNEISVQNIIQIHEDVCKWLQKSSETELSFTIINQKLVSTLAELTAATVHQFHKSGELLSIKECRKTVEEVDALLRLTNALCTEINKLGDKFIKLSSNGISKDSTGDDANFTSEKVDNVMKNSVFYIRQAFNLLIPVMQLGAAV